MKILQYVVFMFVQIGLIATDNESYSFPTATIKVFSPKGFLVSIPDDEGIQLFAFHGNINQPMDGLEAGKFARDIVKKTGNRWIFRERHSRLLKGDVIYYWLFVIKNGIGYRYDNGEYTVEDISPQPKDETQTAQHTPIASTTIRSPTQSHPGVIKTPEGDPRCAAVLNVTNTLEYLSGDLLNMREVIGILKELLSRSDDLSRTLKFEGILPAFDDPQYVAQIVMNEKLGLKLPIMNATKNSDGSITFHLASLDDKINLIRTARKKLEGSKIILSY